MSGRYDIDASSTLRELRQLDESLYSPSDQHPDLCDALHSKIQIEVVAILQHVDRIPLNGIPESALLFPLFLLGGEVTDPLHMDIIHMRLRLMLDKRPFQNILRALEVRGGVGPSPVSSGRS
ncbi:hypothetical protein N7530_000004 [Penicillium desertorum]|uniref:Uncharacterized protein n=1 Tax=Penicillium desertorum TaxID=1303715 RepID=A0A9W9X7V4_9EURO|nr:hypothetical protein N7530_000004 [Penicillium desertorum]